jgi:hypothetical protein
VQCGNSILHARANGRSSVNQNAHAIHESLLRSAAQSGGTIALLSAEASDDK